VTVGALSLIGAVALNGAGCKPNEPPPAHAPVPPSDARSGRAAYTHENAGRPLPPAPTYTDSAVPPPYYDEPLVDQQMPEEPRFVEAYNRVGRPRVTVFMNRTLEGKLVPVNPSDPLVSIKQSRTSTGDVRVDQNSSTRAGSGSDWRSRETQHSADTYDARGGNSSYNESTDIYLRPGQYDEATAKSLDYEAMENTLADWLTASGQVVMISPTLAHQRLSDQQEGAMQSGQKQALDDVARSLNADVLVQVQAHPTKQSREGMKIRVIAEAMNTRGGQSLGRAVVDMPLPMEKTDINRYTRFLARRLMSQMTNVWNAPPPADMRRDEPASAPGARIPESGHDVTPSSARVAPPSTAPASVPAP
jgi:hypothetical protein